VGNAWVYLIPLVILIALMLYGQRARRKAAAEELVRAERIGVGTEVMTTSGLYGTVVAREEDGTVMLSIAPGVEVKWALAALRDAPSMPPQYRRAIDADVDAESGADAGDEPKSAS
jgi:preprotein translocase subunit YajC